MSEASSITQEKRPLLGSANTNHARYDEISSTDGTDSTEANNSVNNYQHFQPTVYKRRWWILIVFCFGSCAQSVLWNTWSPLLDALLIAYDWKDSFVAMLPGISNLGYVLLGFPLMYLVERYGRSTKIYCIFMFCVI